MAEDVVTILKIEAVENLAELRNNIKYLKEGWTDMEGEQHKALNDLAIGSKEYKDRLKELQVNQAALRDAMNGTSASMEDVAKAAQGMGTSYNALVKQMKDLTQEFRATEDVARRNELAKQIKDINDQLKDFDASRGIYGRNVGDYFNQITAPLTDVINALPKGLQAVASGIKNTSDALGVMGKQPVLGMVMLLAPVLTKIVAALQENETALESVKKVMKALEPVMQFFEGIIQKIAEGLSKAVDWLMELGERAGIDFKKIVAGAAGVGNAILQFILTPVRNTIDGAKALGNVFQQVFKGQFKEAAQTAKQAVKDIGENIKKGFDFKGNFALGQQVGEQFAAGLKSSKSKKAAQDAGKTLAEEVQKGALMGWDAIRKRMEAGDKRRDQEAKDLAALALGIDTDTIDYVNGVLDEFEKAEDERLERDRQRKEARKTLLFSYADTVSSVLGSIADMYEDDEEAGEKNAQKVKALRTAAAVIDTISGAIAAYMNGVKAITVPPGAGIALGIAQAATVLAAGMANIKKIQATKVGSGGDSGSASVSALVSAPAYVPNIQQTRSITGRSETERLNRMAEDSRVYLVYSDLEVANQKQRVRVQETAW